MVGIPVQAHVVVGFGLVQIGLAVLEVAQLMIGRGQIIVSVWIARIGVNRLLKLASESWYRAC